MKTGARNVGGFNQQRDKIINQLTALLHHTVNPTTEDMWLVDFARGHMAKGNLPAMMQSTALVAAVEARLLSVENESSEDEESDEY